MRLQAQEELAAGSSGFFLQPQHIQMDVTAGDATAHVMLGQMMLPMPDVAAAPANTDAVQNGANYSELGGASGAAADGSGSMDHHMGYGSDGSDNDEDSGSCHSGDSEVSHPPVVSGASGAGTSMCRIGCVQDSAFIECEFKYLFCA